jgi:hypothetical protein
LVQEPWDADLIGDGYGLLSFYVNDTAELIRIFDIAWIG